jgi:hypothetical protein
MDACQERAMQETPMTVPGVTPAQQTGEPNPKQARRQRWNWAEASIWTDRMLAALETEVKGDVWFRLIDKVYSPKNLWSAWAKSAKNNGAPGVDGITIDRYEKDAEANVEYLSEQLKAGTYQPKPIRRTHIPKPDGTKRPLGIPTVLPVVPARLARFVTSSNRSSRKSSPNTVTAFAPAGDARTRCGGWMACSRPGIDTWWTRI